MIYKNTRGCDLNVRTPRGFSVIKPDDTVSLSGKFTVMNRHKIIRGYLTPAIITVEAIGVAKKLVEVAVKVDEIIDIVTENPDVDVDDDTVAEEPEVAVEEKTYDNKPEKPKRRKRRTKEEIKADEA